VCFYDSFFYFFYVDFDEVFLYYYIIILIGLFGMVNKNEKNESEEEVEDLEKPVDMDLVATQMQFSRDKLRQLRLESATTGKSMASIMRGLLNNHLSDDDEEARELVEDNLDQILSDCDIWGGGFAIDGEDGFIARMSDVGISLADLNDDEWSVVLNKLEIAFKGYNGDVSVHNFVDKFFDLKPSRSQRRDLRAMAREILKNL